MTAVVASKLNKRVILLFRFINTYTRSRLSSALRKRTWDNFTNYLREQWTGFPTELQEGTDRVNRRFGPAVNRTIQSYTNVGKQRGRGAIIDGLRKVPLRTAYTGPNAFQPKAKPDPNKRKGSWWDIVLSPKEQDDIKAAREKWRTGFSDPVGTINQTISKPTGKASGKKATQASKSAIPSYLVQEDKKKVKK